MAIPYINAFPIWYKEQKNKGKIFCLRFDVVGWVDNANKDICIKDDKSIDCPDLILLGSTQISTRYYKGDTLNLNNFFKQYWEKNSVSFESMLNKYSYYDYHIDNNWVGVPLTVDFRIFKFNITTFDYSIE
ncbi:hypothetical protein PIROE2DRAFT_1979 [Piromyces sp. E2]|nr:hypothetical protein PIROE2DRAFT_1979 [Piromyces sp. E2]|eukprot:OUM70030.1 hypothetical protein PIROE2DRAFT_1979 [Piromyces sp. E2]